MLTNLTLTKPDSPFRGGGGGLLRAPLTTLTGLASSKTHTHTHFTQKKSSQRVSVKNRRKLTFTPKQMYCL